LRGIDDIALWDAISIGLIRIDALLEDTEMRHRRQVDQRLTPSRISLDSASPVVCARPGGVSAIRNQISDAGFSIGVAANLPDRAGSLVELTRRTMDPADGPAAAA
jgi:hypothetical protein